MKRKSLFKFLYLLVLAVLLISGCGNPVESTQKCLVSGCDNEVYKDGLSPDHYVASQTDDEGLNNPEPHSDLNSTDADSTEAGDSTAEEAEPSSLENDFDIGLRNIKIDNDELNLTDEQKTVISYFDEDYLDFPDYDSLRKYPTIFENAQISAFGKVLKVISMDSNSYKLVVFVGMRSFDDEWLGEEYYNEHEGEYVIVNGDNSGRSEWLMEEDDIVIYGRYNSVETIDIDGVSYTLPVIDAYDVYYDEGSKAVSSINKFDYSDIKAVASAIFGDDIEIREPVVGEDISESVEEMNSYFGTEPAYLVVELEDQSNAKFTKFLFGTDAGYVLDNKEMLDTEEKTIEREIEFSADFSHFYLFAYDKSLETLNLSYYDNSYNKIWSRDFEETTSAVYDYTKNNIYIVVNNNLYIIDINTGEDIFEPQYVEGKKDIRKLSDGIILIGTDKSDAVIKTGLDGTIEWQTNLSTDISKVSGVQLVNGNIVVQYIDADWNDYYALISDENGELLVETQ